MANSGNNWIFNEHLRRKLLLFDVAAARGVKKVSRKCDHKLSFFHFLLGRLLMGFISPNFYSHSKMLRESSTTFIPLPRDKNSNKSWMESQDREGSSSGFLKRAMQQRLRDFRHFVAFYWVLQNLSIHRSVIKKFGPFWIFGSCPNRKSFLLRVVLRLKKAIKFEKHAKNKSWS